MTRPKEIYLDNNATTPVLPEVREAMMGVLGDGFGNASSIHEAGYRARAEIGKAREFVARLLGACTDNIVFTSSGTEANNVALLSILNDASRRRVVTTSIEHSSVLKTCEYLERQGVEVEYLSVGGSGCVSIDEVARAVTPNTGLVSVQWVNNETGAIQPVEAIAQLCRDRGVPFHTDAAQAFGKLAIDVGDVGVDFVTVTAHKIHGPQGVGAFYARDLKRIEPLFYGGPQERGLRPGTENLPAIVGFGEAVRHRGRRFDSILQHVRGLRDRFEHEISDQLPGTRINGDVAARVPNVTNLQFLKIDGEAMVVQLDQAGIRCSQSSACTNQRPEPSYVLRSMGLSESQAYSSVRFSFSELNTLAEVGDAARNVVRICREQRTFLGTGASDQVEVNR